jgi:hypothetical protein
MLLNDLRDKSRTRCTLGFVMAALAVVPAVQAQGFLAIDSLTVRGITFVAELDRLVYGPTDTIRARLVAVNPSSSPIVWPAQRVFFPSIFFGEQWCNTSLDSCTAIDFSDIRAVGDVDFLSFLPGRTVVDAQVHASECPGPGWFQNYGIARYHNPCDYPFSFTFNLQYSRVTTALQATSWSRIKALYRR